MNRQEMFTKAVVGLRSQGWLRSMSANGNYCVYQSNDGRRCAWGHVDPCLTFEQTGVMGLCDDRIGVAADMSVEDLTFAEKMQEAHDSSLSPSIMEMRFKNLAVKFALTFPESP